MFISRSTRLVFVFLTLMITNALVPAAAQVLPAKSTVASRIVLPVDDSIRVTIPHSTHPLATSAYDVGPVNGSTAFQRMILVLGGSPDQEYQARTLVDSQQSKGSPEYHRWLTPEEYGQKFGPSPQDIGQVTGWLQQHGFAIGNVAKSGRWIEFSGTSAQVEAAFQTRMRQYLVGGELHVANATDISIPAALSPVVRGVLSLYNFYSQPMLRRSRIAGPVKLGRGQPNATDSNGDHFVTPGDVANIYDLNPLYKGTTHVGTINGSGTTIALVAVGNINSTAATGVDDVAAFQNAFGLPVHDPTIILNGPDPGVDGASDEASLDVEYSGAVAPGATVDLVVSGGSLTTDPVALSSAFIVDQNLADVMSVSFGICEQALGSGTTILNNGNPFWNALWEQAAAQGISVFVSSGDTGAAGCDPNNPPGPSPATGGLGVNGIGSTPFNTAVGGTEFNETVNGGTASTFWNTTNGSNLASAIGYIPEMVWNDSCAPTTPGSFCAQQGVFALSAGGGGISTIYGVPSYQTLNIQGLAGASFPFRPVPDVSLDASNDHDSYIFCFTPPQQGADCQVSGNQVFFNNFAGGTSFSSPEFAGIMALVDQALHGRQGLANYVLYSLAATESGSFSSCNSSNQTKPGTPPGSQCVFNDVTAGNNGVPGNDTLSSFVPPEDGDKAGQTGYNAGPGYDPAVGLGSVNAATLVNTWAGVTFEGSTTTLTTNPTTVSITHGQPISVSVSVAKQSSTETGTPSGNISLLASGGNLPSNVGITSEPISGSGGTATAGPVNVNNLPGGTSYSLSASFPGDGVFAGSLSNAVTVTVTPENSTTALQSFLVNLNTSAVTPNPSSVGYGDPVNILVIDADTLGISGLIPTIGSVAFSNNQSQPMGTVGIDNSGISEFANCFNANCLPILPPGQQYSISAMYSGDGLSYNGSTSGNQILITITKGTPIPAISTLSTAGMGVPFTVNVLIGTLGTIAPTGTVQLLDGGTALGGPVTVSGGQATGQVTLNSGGNHNITAQYSGDATYNAATSAAATVAVAAPFNFSATATSQTISPGQTATYNVTLNGVGGFAGQVNFNCTGAPGGATCAVIPNPATLSATTTTVPLTVTVSNTANARIMPNRWKSLPFVFAGLLAVVLAGVRRKPRYAVLMLLGVFLVAGIASCGGGGNSTPTPTTATLTVTGTSGSVTNTITLTLTVN